MKQKNTTDTLVERNPHDTLEIWYPTPIKNEYRAINFYPLAVGPSTCYVAFLDNNPLSLSLRYWDHPAFVPLNQLTADIMALLRDAENTFQKTCKRCTYRWNSRVINPSACPACHSKLWNTERRNKLFFTAKLKAPYDQPVFPLKEIYKFNKKK